MVLAILKISMCAGGVLCVGIIKSFMGMSVLSFMYVTRLSFLVCIAVMFVVGVWSACVLTGVGV